MNQLRFGSCFVAALLVACSDTAGPGATPPGVTPPAADAGPDASAFESGTELRVVVPESGRAYVKLATPEVVAVGGDPKASLDWDLAFEGFDVFTNGGVSGGGQAGGFGPLDTFAFLGDVAPGVPFISADKAGGAFLDWYKYEGGSTHALWSRYHVVGVKDGARLWKVQVLTYYGDRDGAPISGLYKIRYAELTASGAGPTQELAGLDGSAGGAQAPPATPSECLDLGTGARTMLTPDAARASAAWHLCFRRQSISVNGESGGPRGVGAVDLSADQVATEELEPIKALTAESAKPKFDAATTASFAGKAFRGDRIVSAFGDAWVDRKVLPFAPANAAWLVVNASGKQKFLLGIGAFEKPTTKSPGVVVMRVKPVKG
jgi:hypothetical protein